MSWPESIASAIVSSKMKEVDELINHERINTSYMYPLGCYYFN
jgi:hypothetical protein